MSVLGGPPCQEHSKVRHLRKAQQTEPAYIFRTYRPRRRCRPALAAPCSPRSSRQTCVSHGTGLAGSSHGRRYDPPMPRGHVTALFLFDVADAIDLDAVRRQVATATAPLSTK